MDAQVEADLANIVAVVLEIELPGAGDALLGQLRLDLGGADGGLALEHLLEALGRGIAFHIILRLAKLLPQALGGPAQEVRAEQVRLRVAGPELEIADDEAIAPGNGVAVGGGDFLAGGLGDEVDVLDAIFELIADAHQAVVVAHGALEWNERVGSDQVASPSALPGRAPRLSLSFSGRA